MSSFIRARVARAALAGTALAGTVLAGTVAAGSAAAGTRPASAPRAALATRAAAITGRPGKAGFIRPPCATAAPGQARCFLVYRPQAAVNRAMLAGRKSAPHGLSARSIRSAYNLPSRKSSDQTVAVSIAFHTPGLAQFLATYRKQFGLPPCTVASGCFRQVNQHGKAQPGRTIRGRHRMGPGSHFGCVDDLGGLPPLQDPRRRSQQPSLADLAATDATAARLGAQVISNSYGAGESGYSLPYRRDYQQRGHTIVASSGDAGFTAAQFPADLPNVTAVGGTMLTRAPGTRRGWKEATWHQPFGAGGSGCSAWITKPAWQHDTHCPARTIADISAVATNIPVYNRLRRLGHPRRHQRLSPPDRRDLRTSRQRRHHDHRPPIPAPRRPSTTSPPAPTPCSPPPPRPAATTTCAEQRKATTPPPA